MVSSAWVGGGGLQSVMHSPPGLEGLAQRQPLGSRSTQRKSARLVEGVRQKTNEDRRMFWQTLQAVADFLSHPCTSGPIRASAAGGRRGQCFPDSSQPPDSSCCFAASSSTSKSPLRQLRLCCLLLHYYCAFSRWVILSTRVLDTSIFCSTPDSFCFRHSLPTSIDERSHLLTYPRLPRATALRSSRYADCQL